MQSGDGPLIPILDGRVDVKMFSSLREHDVGEILEVTVLSFYVAKSLNKCTDYSICFLYGLLYVCRIIQIIPNIIATR